MGDSKKRCHYKNKTNYHFQAYKKKRVQSLEAGLKGFFCTCNIQEKNCIREAYNILNEYADKMYGAEGSSERGDTENIEELEDICDELEKQISELKAGGKRTSRFHSVVTSVPNCVFITADVEDPVKLGYSIVEDISNTKIQKTRFLLRLVPIEITCSTKMDDIMTTAGKLFDKHFLGEATTFSIVFNRRYNNSISREGIIKEMAEMIISKNCNHKVDLTKSKMSVIVEVVKGTCLMSVVPNYFQYKKYNLLELCGKPEEKQENSEQCGEPEGNQEPSEQCDISTNAETTEDSTKNVDSETT